MSETHPDHKLKRHQPAVYLQALLAGQEIALDGRIYKLFREGDAIVTPSGPAMAARAQLCTRAHSSIHGDVWLGADLSLAAFVVLAEAASFDDAFLVSAGTVLRRLNARRAKRTTGRTFETPHQGIVG